MNRIVRIAAWSAGALTCTVGVTAPAFAAPALAAPSAAVPAAAAVVAAPSAGSRAAAPSPTAPSAARGDRGVDAIKRAVTTRIDKRLAALKRLTTTLTEAKHVQPAHRETLTKLLADQTSGLTALRAKVQSETTREALKTDARSMVADHRVFLLTAPKVRLTAAIDTELAAIEKLRGNKDADIAKLDAIEKSLSGQVDTLLAINPGPDAAQIREAVKPVRAAAKQARTSLKALRK